MPIPSYVSSSSTGSVTSPLTLPVDLGSPGTNRMLVVAISTPLDYDGYPPFWTDNSTVQLGGVDMHFVISYQAFYHGKPQTISWTQFYLLKESDLPQGTSADLVVTWWGNTYNAVIVGAVLLENVEQNYSFTKVVAHSTKKQDSWSNPIIYTPDALLVDAMGCYEVGGGATPDSGQTECVDYDLNGALFMSYKEGLSSPQDMGWSWNNKHRCQTQIRAAFKYEAPTP